MQPLIELTSERSALVRVGGTEAVAALTGHLLKNGRFGNLHPAYSSVLVEFDPLRMCPAHAVMELQSLCARVDWGVGSSSRRWEVPVRYGGEFGPDLPAIAAQAGLSEQEAVELHASVEYLVAFLGFSPGFPYLRGLPNRLATPRLSQPRTHVPAGSVAIGGTQTGIYPADSPGGWRVMGWTHLCLFDINRTPPALFAPGDRIRFVPLARP
jgi:KipI family sensor histidine kinase inhibitor